MKSRITLETAIRIIKYGIVPIDCWPIPAGSTGLALFRYHFCVWFGYIYLTASVLMGFWDMYINIDNTLKVVKIASETTALSSALGKMIVCQAERFRLESLINRMEDYLKRANQEEKDLIQTYVDKCFLPHAIVFMSAILGPVAFLLTPLVTPQILPTEMSFPFDYTPHGILIICYIWDIFCITQVGCMVMIDIFFAILLWYTGVRFCILALEFKKATSAEDISRCAMRHQELLRYVDDLKFSTRRIAIVVTGIAFVGVTTGGLVLIQHPSPIDVARYLFFEVAAMMELLLITWPADHLTEKSREIGMAAYGCDWIGKSPKMLRDILIVVQRSQIPITISVDGLIPPLSLEFYRAAMAATFSYITTLRAITVD